MKSINQAYDLNKIIENIYVLINNRYYDQAKKILLAMHYADIADLIDQMCTDDDLIDFLSSIATQLPPQTLYALNFYALIKITTILGSHKFADMINKIDLSDAVDIVGKFSVKQREEILSYCDETKAQEIAKGLSYLYDTIGRVMAHNMIVVLDFWTVKQTKDYVKKTLYDLHDKTYFIIVVNNKYKPIKAVNLCELLVTEPDKCIHDLSAQEIKVVNTNTKIDDVSYLFKQYELEIIAVVNKLGRVVGIVPAANMISIISEQNEEYILQLGGVNSVDDTFANAIDTVKHRFPWLSINLVLSFLTAIVVNYFSITIKQKVALAAIIPIVASLSSNAATQVMTVTVRSLATNQYQLNHFTARIITKEILVSFINALGLTMLGLIFMWSFYNELKLTIVFGCTVMLNFIVFSTLGCAIPIILNKFKIDPAVPSNTILNNLPDFFSYLSLLLIASYIFP